MCFKCGVIDGLTIEECNCGKWRPKKDEHYFVADPCEMDKLWEKFAKSGLVTGAWSGMDWKDLPDHVQDEFLEFTREVRRAFCMH